MQIKDYAKQLDELNTDLYAIGYVDKTDRMKLIEMAVRLKCAEIMGRNNEKCKRDISKK